MSESPYQIPRYDSRLLIDLLELCENQVLLLRSCPPEQSEFKSICVVAYEIYLSTVEIAVECCRLLKARNILCFDILGRTIVEYTIDLATLTFSKDRASLLEQFVHYSNLIGLWQIHEVDTEQYGSDIDRVNRQAKSSLDVYDDGRLQMSVATLRKLTESNMPNSLPWHKLADTLKSHGCMRSGESLSSITISSELTEDDATYWTELGKNLKRRFGHHWSGRDFQTRAKQLMRIDESSKNVIDALRKMYIFGSQKTHLTPYSIVGYNVKDGDYDAARCATDEGIELRLTLILAIQNYALRTVVRSLPKHVALHLAKAYRTTIEGSAVLSKCLEK